jgi:hypothetical protein
MFMFTLIVIHNHQSYSIKLSYMVQHIKLPPSMSYMEVEAFIMCYICLVCVFALLLGLNFCSVGGE